MSKVITPDMEPLSNFYTDESREYSDEELRNFMNTPMRWVVPAEALEAAYDWSQLPQPPLMVLPAQEELWRDAAHYKAYVRPVESKEETE